VREQGKKESDNCVSPVDAGIGHHHQFWFRQYGFVVVPLLLALDLTKKDEADRTFVEGSPRVKTNKNSCNHPSKRARRANNEKTNQAKNEQPSIT
jgi:hypothetical protein